MNRTAAFRTFHAGAVSFIDNQMRIVKSAQVQQFRNGRPIAIHAEDGFDNNDLLARPGLAPQRVFQCIQVQVRKDHAPRPGQPDTIDQACVICAV